MEVFGTTKCLCHEGYQGDFCEKIKEQPTEKTIEDFCAAQPCKNDGRCLNMREKFFCVCPPAYTGLTCESKLDPCASSPCAEGATCVTELMDTFSCKCPHGTTGRRCEDRYNACHSAPCQHGGTCTEDAAHADNYTCKCEEGYKGAFCETEVDPCEDNACGDHGLCVAISRTKYHCQCLGGYTGVLCDVATTYVPPVTEEMWESSKIRISQGMVAHLLKINKTGEIFFLIISTQPKENLMGFIIYKKNHPNIIMLCKGRDNKDSWYRQTRPLW